MAGHRSRPSDSAGRNSARPYRHGSWACRDGAAYRAHAWASLHDEAAAAPHPPSRGPGFGGNRAEEREAGSDSVLVTTTEARLKLSVLLDPALDSELARPPQAKFLEVHTSHVELRGAKSSEDTEPSLSSSSESEQHNSWNQVRGLCGDYFAEPIIEHILTEGEPERVVLSCRFAVDFCCE